MALDSIQILGGCLNFSLYAISSFSCVSSNSVVAHFVVIYAMEQTISVVNRYMSQSGSYSVCQLICYSTLVQCFFACFFFSYCVFFLPLLVCLHHGLLYLFLLNLKLMLFLLIYVSISLGFHSFTCFATQVETGTSMIIRQEGSLEMLNCMRLVLALVKYAGWLLGEHLTMSI